MNEGQRNNVYLLPCPAQYSFGLSPGDLLKEINGITLMRRHFKQSWSNGEDIHFTLWKFKGIQQCLSARLVKRILYQNLLNSYLKWWQILALQVRLGCSSARLGEFGTKSYLVHLGVSLDKVKNYHFLHTIARGCSAQEPNHSKMRWSSDRVRRKEKVLGQVRLLFRQVRRGSEENRTWFICVCPLTKQNSSHFLRTIARGCIAFLIHAPKRAKMR